jgi:hypothetical protein
MSDGKEKSRSVLTVMIKCKRIKEKSGSQFQNKVVEAPVSSINSNVFLLLASVRNRLL